MKSFSYISIIFILSSCGSNNIDSSSTTLHNSGLTENTNEISFINITDFDKLADLEVMTEDLPMLNWEDAKKKCENLDDGWRLPNNYELKILHINMKEIGGFEEYGAYWSSSLSSKDEEYPWYFRMFTKKGYSNYVKEFASAQDAGRVPIYRNVGELRCKIRKDCTLNVRAVRGEELDENRHRWYRAYEIFKDDFKMHEIYHMPKEKLDKLLYAWEIEDMRASDMDHMIFGEEKNINLDEVIESLKENQKPISESLIEFNDETDEVSTEEFREEKANETVKYYKIQDPDGYTNMRNSPGGSIIRKVLPNEKFKVTGESGKYKVVKFDSGETGYIHNSRVVEY